MCVRAHGASALNKVTESSLALPKGSEWCCSVYARFSSVGRQLHCVCVCLSACVFSGEAWGLCLDRVDVDQS